MRSSAPSSRPSAAIRARSEILLAVERGELDGIVGYSWGVARSGNKDRLDSGKLKIVLQLALDKHKELPNVSLVTDFVSRAQRHAGAGSDLLAPVDGPPAGRAARSSIRA